MTRPGFEAHGPKGNQDPKKRGLDKAIKNMKEENKGGLLRFCGLLLYVPFIALVAIVTILLAGCMPMAPNAPASSTARKFYVGAFVKQGGALIHGRADVQISAIGGKDDPGRPGEEGYAGIPNGPVSVPWENHFAIERDYDKSVTVNLTMTYIAPGFVADELTCYISTKSYDDAGWEASIIDSHTQVADHKKAGSSILLAYCLAQIKPLP